MSVVAKPKYYVKPRNEKTEPMIIKHDVQQAIQDGVHPVVTALLRIRKYRDDTPQTIVRCDLNSLSEPDKIYDMSSGASVLHKHISNGNKICIYGDYDADGVTSVSVLSLFFSEGLKYDNYFVYFPNRFDEGYGLNTDAVSKIIDEYKADCIITVDCGITSFDEAELAKSKNTDMIIVDHHTPKDGQIPDKAVAVINPMRSECDSGLDYMCGCGLTWKFVQCYVQSYLPDESFNPNSLLDIVAVGTVADLVPIIGENRIIVRAGLNKINNDLIDDTVDTGIKRIIKKIGLDSKNNIAEGDLGFYVGPCLNASGRLDTAYYAYYALTFNSDDNDGIDDYSLMITQMNNQRKEVEKGVFADVIKKIEADEDYHTRKKRIIVAYSPEWNKGVIGIAASRLVEAFNLPVFLFGGEPDEKGYITGSSRSISGIHLFNELTEFSKQNPHILEQDKFGGHEMAAGLGIHKDKLSEFAKKFNEQFADKDETIFDKKIRYDLCVDAQKINKNFIRNVEKFAPFGIGNSKPMFLLENERIQNFQIRESKKGNKFCTLVIDTAMQGFNLSGIYFGDVDDELLHLLSNNQSVSLVVTVDINSYTNYAGEYIEKPQVVIKHIW